MSTALVSENDLGPTFGCWPLVEIERRENEREAAELGTSCLHGMGDKLYVESGTLRR
jgi:hypothetical protein